MNPLSRSISRLAMLAFAFLLTSSPVEAQRVPQRGARIAIGLEFANGRMPLFTGDATPRPKARESFVVGGRLSVDVGVARHLALEFAFASDAYIPRDVSVYDFVLAPRTRFFDRRDSREWYLRPLVGAAFLEPSRTHVGLSAGLGFGLRRQVTSQYDAFLEIGYRLRWFRDLDPGFAADTWRGYTSSSGERPDAMFCFLGITAGIGISFGDP